MQKSRSMILMTEIKSSETVKKHMTTEAFLRTFEKSITPSELEYLLGLDPADALDIYHSSNRSTVHHHPHPEHSPTKNTLTKSSNYSPLNPATLTKKEGETQLKKILQETIALSETLTEQITILQRKGWNVQCH